MKTPRTLLSRILAGSVAAGLFLSATASAATYTWDANGAAAGVTDGAGTWNTTAGNAVWWDGATNSVWSNSGPNDAIFGNSNGAAGTVTIGTAITVGNLTFNPAGSGNYALTAANDSQPLTFSVATPTITTNASATIGARVVSGGGFVKEGLGTLTLKGATAGGTQNAIGGTITVNAGTLVIGPQFSFSGQAAFQGHLTLANLARFRMVQGNFLSNTGVFTVGNDAYAEINEFGDDVGAIAGSGRINIAATSVLEVQSGSGDFTGVLSGAGGLRVGASSQTLSGANLHTGITTIATSGTLVLNNVNAVQYSTLNKATSGNVTFAVAGTNTYNIGALASGGTLNIGGNTISVGASNLGALSDAAITGSGGLTKLGTNTQTLRGASTYTGPTTIGGGTIQLLGSGALSTSSPITFTGTGGFSITGGIRTVGALIRTAGNATITSTHDNANTSLTFSSLAARTAGATANFVASGGTNGTTNKIVLTGAAPGFIDHGSYFGGNNFAWNDATGYVRAIQYNGVEGVSTAGGLSLASAAHQETTAAVTAQTNASFTTLKITGAHAFTLAAAQTMTVDGLLKTGTNATLSGGAGIQASSGQDLVVRTHAEADALTINTPILANGGNALAKAGLGSLTLGALAVNTYTGGTFVNEGTLIVIQDSNFGSTAVANNVVLNGGTLQPSANIALHANHGIDIGPGGGTLYGVGFGLTLGSANMLSGSGPLAITGDPTTVPVLTSSATQDYAGRMTLGVDSFFRAQIALGADNLTNPFGTGDITVVSGAGSAIFVNRPGSVWNNRFFLSGNGEGNRGVLRTQQGGTFNGDIILTTNAGISSDGTGTTTTLNGNISGAFVLTLGGLTGANAANKYVLTGNNVHSATTIGLGITNIDHDVALGAYNGTVTLHGNATLQAGAAGIILNPDHTVALSDGATTASHNIDTQANTMTIQGVITGASTETLVKLGSGTLKLSGANTYTGTTTINAGTLELAGGAAIQDAGAVLLANAAGASLQLDASETIGSLSGGGALGGDVNLQANTLTLSGSSATTFNGTIGGTGGGLTVNGTGSLTLDPNVANTFTGATSIGGTATLVAHGTGALSATSGITVNTGGTLLLAGGTGNRIGDSVALTLAGGVLNTAGLSEAFGTLTLTANSVINFGAGASLLVFANSTGLWGANRLDLWNWSGTPYIGGGADQLRFASNGLNATQLGNLHFYSDAGVTEISFSLAFPANGFVGSLGEVVPVPEPSSVFVGLALFGLAGWRERRRSHVRRRDDRRQLCVRM